MFHLLCDRPVWNWLGNALLTWLAPILTRRVGRDENVLSRDLRLSDECP
jgi:hypothetical protein